MSPPAAIGAAFVAMGASAATGMAVAAVATAVYTGAVYGALTGAVTALVTGGDIKDSAIKGAVIGGVSGGVMRGIGIATGSSPASAGVGEAGMETAAAGNTTGGQAGVAGSGGQGVVVATGQPAVSPTTTTAPNVTTPPVKEGLLSRAGNWIESNPTQATLLAQTVGGAAKGVSDKRAAEQDLEAQMRMTQLEIDSKKVGGLSGLDIMEPLPSVGSFMETPKWEMPKAGLLEAQNATA